MRVTELAGQAGLGVQWMPHFYSQYLYFVDN